MPNALKRLNNLQNYTEKYSNDFKKINILMVDDSKENLLALEAVLRAEEYNLVMANSGREALSLLLKQDFAMILLDVQMPEISGFETAKLVRSIEKTKHIPIIFITAFDQAKENVADCYALGAIDYIIKPFKPDQLRYKVKALGSMYKNQREQYYSIERLLLEKQREAMGLAKIVESSNDGMVSCSLDGVINSWNYGAQKIYKYTKIEAVGQPLNQVLDKRSWRQLSPIIEEVLKGKYISDYEVVQFDKDGVSLNLSISAFPLYEKATIYGLALTIRDITEKKYLENQLIKLDKFNLIAQMSAGVAHEVRNPLTAVYGFLKLFKKKPEFAGYDGHLDVMISEIERVNSIITEFLSISKTSTQAKERLDLNQIVTTITPLIKANAIQFDVDIELDLAPIPPLDLDEKEIRQLLFNLIGNGLDAIGDKKGKITIKTNYERNMVNLIITDEGPGIPQEVMDKIGSPFFTTKDHGSGLGLAICNSIAERHNGFIDIETGEQGSTFIVRFRLEEKYGEKQGI